MRIYKHLQYLNTNTTLYNAIVKAESEGALLSEESRKAANNLRADFEKGGIHLPKDKLERVNQLNLAIAHLGRKTRQTQHPVSAYPNPLQSSPPTHHEDAELRQCWSGPSCLR
ncbi:mitochondrial intermediate peptidase, mitochondrial-like [Hordeum vulgare subsp. vulgare]|uniref:mitochondrial intermediate peptidase, mitochondrial-like n=1 Tax=Hordeum vulgare subsp. vulgare TaxID=112509 RepID=UPI001D1A3AC8|nr:mitochondrial intermediate peptidase, mitochondrial-like [Hordeum vulgare subsp. vulgare]